MATNLAVLVGVLERLDQTESLVDGASDRQVVDGDLTQVLLAVDDEQTAEWDSGLLLQHAVSARGGERFVGQQRVLDVAQASFFARRVDPSQMGEVRVGGDPDDLAVDVAELLHPLRERDDLRWADEGAGRGNRGQTLFGLLSASASRGIPWWLSQSRLSHVERQKISIDVSCFSRYQRNRKLLPSQTPDDEVNDNQKAQDEAKVEA